MSEATSIRATRPAEGEQADLAGHYDTDGMLTVEWKGNPFMRSPSGGRVLSAMMLPYFTLRPPLGFGVLTTTGRRTGKKRRKCIRAIRQGEKTYIVMIRPKIAHKASAWVLNIRADPNVSLRMRGGTFAGLARELDDDEELRQARELYCGAVNPFDYGECTFHRGSRPTRSKVQELHRIWFDTGIPLVVEGISEPLATGFP
jgi:deazaflavin-dependent oxidoreductase (nitroreductase family)